MKVTTLTTRKVKNLYSSEEEEHYVPRIAFVQGLPTDGVRQDGPGIFCRFEYGQRGELSSIQVIRLGNLSHDELEGLAVSVCLDLVDAQEMASMESGRKGTQP